MPRITRRHFLGATSAAAGAYILGKPGTSLGAQDTRIAYAKIHPAIGIARVGNSPDGFFVGPEVVEPDFTAADNLRDAQGAIKRQAARFRVYGYNSAHQPVRELTADEAEITWQVHVANKKAEWFRFIAAMDIPDSRDIQCARRNADVKGTDRQRLVIDPGPHSVFGRDARPVRLEGGKFLDVPVNLGELRTDAHGRLLVLGGQGKSESVPGGRPPYNPDDAETFNNADGWYDDMGDGPVRATVKLHGHSLKVVSAWVVVAPPNYAPDVVGWRTLYDLLVDTYIDAGRMALPATTSFTHDILPILRRLSGLQWVNQGFEQAFGRNDQMNQTPPDAAACRAPNLPPDAAKACRLDFDNPDHIAQFAAKTSLASGANTFRALIYNRFRLPQTDQKNQHQWPMIYGDGDPLDEQSDLRSLAVSKTRALHLKRWLDGNYDDDWNVVPATPIRELSQLAPADQPAMLDRAALHFCLADAFHPGCELTWPMRHISMYSPDPRNPFRIRERLTGEVEPPHRERLIARNYNQYLGPQSAGDLTKWMAVPWQGDTIFCRSGYEPEFDPYIPTYWPARVPNHVLSEADYEIVMDQSKDRAVRLAAYRRRKFWTRSITGSAPEQINQMVRDFGKLGIIEARPGVANDPDLPAVMLVESLPPGAKEKGLEFGAPGGVRTHSPLPFDFVDPIRRAGWESDEQLKEFRRLRGMKRRRRTR